MKLALIILSILLQLGFISAGYKLCYYDSLSEYRNGTDKFDPGTHVASAALLCSHLVFGYASLDTTRYAVTVPSSAITIISAATAVNPAIVPILSVGGPAIRSSVFSDMAQSTATRAMFIESLVTQMTSLGFKGVDIYWKWPTFDGGRDEDRNNFIALLNEIRNIIGIKFNKNVMLTVTVSGDPDVIDVAYGVNMYQIGFFADLVNVAAFDYHTDWGTWVGNNAPLYVDPEDERQEDKLKNVEHSINYWIETGGVHSYKTILGIPAHGHGYIAQEPEGTPLDQIVNPGLHTGIINFFEICQLTTSGAGFTVMWDTIGKVPTARSSQLWISYEDISSIVEKCAFGAGLGGVALYGIDQDDFTGACGLGGTAYPLLEAISKSCV